MDLFRLFLRDFGTPLADLWVLFMIGLTIAFPFMVISVVRNVAAIRRALERIADATEAQRSSGGGGVLGL
jgi:ABC-type molybdate transport system permease subunit